MNFIKKVGFRSGLNLVVGHKSRSRRYSEKLGSLLAKQNPSLNETLDEIYKEERRGFSASLGSWQNPLLDGLSFPNTDSKNALKLLVRNYMGPGPLIKVTQHHM